MSSCCERCLIVGGCETDGDGVGVSKAASCGLSAWRILSGAPYYKQVASYEDDIQTVSSIWASLSLWDNLNVTHLF